MQQREGIKQTTARTVSIIQAHFLKTCDYERNLIGLRFEIMQTFKPVFRCNANMGGNQSDYDSHFFDDSGSLFEIM